MTLEETIRDRLELVNGKVYWKKCALYAWCPCKIRAGKENHWGDRIIKIDGEAYEEFKIIHYLTTRET